MSRELRVTVTEEPCNITNEAPVETLQGADDVMGKVDVFVLPETGEKC